jgi:enamine deaminase RidA (YjgF/YER057c/UK114 family)
VSRRLVASGSPLEPEIGFSRAVRVGASVWVAGTAPIWPSGEVDPDVTAQAERCLEVVDAALREAGAALSDVVRTRVYLVDRAYAPAVAAVHGRAFGAVRPASVRRRRRLPRPALARRDRSRRRRGLTLRPA